MNTYMGKSLALAVLALVSFESRAFLSAIEEANSDVTAEWIAREGVFKPFARELLNNNLPTGELFAAGPLSLHLSELWDTFADIFVEYTRAKLFNGNEYDAVRLTTFGALGHKLWIAICDATGLTDQVSQQTRDNYDRWGKPYFKAVFAHAIDNAFKNLSSKSSESSKEEGEQSDDDAQPEADTSEPAEVVAAE